MLAGWTLATPFLLLLLPLLTIQESEDRFGMRLAAQLERGSVGLKPNSLSLVSRRANIFAINKYLHDFLRKHKEFSFEFV
jgi:hypothetical protein